MIFARLVLFVLFVGFTCAQTEVKKKSVKRGIDEGYPLGYNGWASSLKLGPAHDPTILERPNGFAPTSHELSHLVSAAKKAAHDVYVAQQYVLSAKEDVIFVQNLVKEKEAQALIAHQKSEAAQQVFRAEAHNVVVAQQKLAKAKGFAAELQLKQAVKDAEAARAIQSSASQANHEIQKAEQAAKLSFYKHSIGPKSASIYPGYAAHGFSALPWAVPAYHAKPVAHF